MRKVTTTKKINDAITNNLLQVVKVEIRHKSSEEIDTISVDRFKESLEFLTETVFSDMIDWHYERNLSGEDGYILDSGAMNSYSEDIVIAYLRVGNGVSGEDVGKALLYEEG